MGRMVGIKSYATYIPKYRIRVDDIAQVWKKRPENVIDSLQVMEKAVAAADEDAVTLAVAASNAVISILKETSNGSSVSESIDIVFVGSESHPYAVNPTSTIVGEMLGLGNAYMAADFEFACKAATAGIQASLGLIKAGLYRNALIIGTDCAQSKPHDVLEYTSASAAAAFIIGKDENVVATVKAVSSFSSDTPDFWRRDGIKYPSHGGRFTGKPAYFQHIRGAARVLFEKTERKPADFTYCVFHMPNGKFPRRIAKQLGFSQNQLAGSLVVDSIGNPYSASSLIGLAAILDSASAGETIFMVSYGSGAGADGFVFEVTDKIVDFRKKQKETVIDQIEKKKHVSYVEYLKMTNKI